MSYHPSFISPFFQISSCFRVCFCINQKLLFFSKNGSECFCDKRLDRKKNMSRAWQLMVSLGCSKVPTLSQKNPDPFFQLCDFGLTFGRLKLHRSCRKNVDAGRHRTFPDLASAQTKKIRYDILSTKKCLSLFSSLRVFNITCFERVSFRFVSKQNKENFQMSPKLLSPSDPKWNIQLK